jgi:hypothetical protein
MLFATRYALIDTPLALVYLLAEDPVVLTPVLRGVGSLFVIEHRLVFRI